MLQRLSASLRLGRAIAAQQRAAFHLSAAVEAGRRKEDSDSEDEANPKPFPAAEAADDGEQLWPPPIDQSQLRNPGGLPPPPPPLPPPLPAAGQGAMRALCSAAAAAQCIHTLCKSVPARLSVGMHELDGLACPCNAACGRHRGRRHRRPCCRLLLHMLLHHVARPSAHRTTMPHSPPHCNS